MCEKEDICVDGAIASPQILDSPDSMGTWIRDISRTPARFEGTMAYDAHVPVGSGVGSTHASDCTEIESEGSTESNSSQTLAFVSTAGSGKVASF